MHASQPIRPAPSRFDGHLGALALVIVVALGVAIVKPWQGPGGPDAVVAPTPSPTLEPTPSPTAPPQLGFEGLVYDPSIFGFHEPEATWGIWPAGYLTTFGFVVQVPGQGAGAASSVPAGSTSPHASPARHASASPSPPPSEAGIGPSWPAQFVVPEGDHLFLIGINMPSGISLTSAHLNQYPAVGDPLAVTIQELKPPWTHFAVIAIPTAPGSDRLNVWKAGRYRLDLTFGPGAISRSIEIDIAGPA